MQKKRVLIILKIFTPNFQLCTSFSPNNKSLRTKRSALVSYT